MRRTSPRKPRSTPGASPSSSRRARGARDHEAGGQRSSRRRARSTRTEVWRLFALACVMLVGSACAEGPCPWQDPRAPHHGRRRRRKERRHDVRSAGARACQKSARVRGHRSGSGAALTRADAPGREPSPTHRAAPSRTALQTGARRASSSRSPRRSRRTTTSTATESQLTGIGASTSPRTRTATSLTTMAAPIPTTTVTASRTRRTSAPTSRRTWTASRTKTAVPDPDNDANRIADLDDFFCPNTPGVNGGDKPGCPKKNSLVVVTEKEIRITQQIQFRKFQQVDHPARHQLSESSTGWRERPERQPQDQPRGAGAIRTTWVATDTT